MTGIEVENIFHLQQRFRWETKTWNIEHRKNLLRMLKDAVIASEKEICSALNQDFAKPELESLMTEVHPVLEEIKLTLQNLSSWARPRAVRSGLLLLGTSCQIRPEPRGTVLIIAPWNYPFSLSLVPLISAIAAGNTIILKPSELTPQTSQLLEKIISDLFEPGLVAVIQGDKGVSQKLLKLPFDHIFFTGSTQVGRIVMAAASENLTSLTLELGGKSPTVVHSSCDLPLAVEKIVWAKFLNGGQTCVAPDYVLVDEKIAPIFADLLELEIKKQLPGGVYAQSITSTHLERLQKLVAEAVVAGAQAWTLPSQEGARRLGPTVVKNAPLNSRLMTEEIFGPVLPFSTFRELAEVIHFINDRPKPLALYLFAKERGVVETLIAQTSSGGMCVNDAIIHLGNHRLPFGGVGESGFGNYHGEAGFRTFSHEKSILRQGYFARMINRFYPPYTEKKLQQFRFLRRWLP